MFREATTQSGRYPMSTKGSSSGCKAASAKMIAADVMSEPTIPSRPLTV